MDISEKYLERFKLRFDEANPLFALTATELSVAGVPVQAPTSAVNLDPPADSGLPTGIQILRVDTHEDLFAAIDAMAEGTLTERQNTFINVVGNSDTLWRFQGLLSDVDARLWVRNHLDFPTEPDVPVPPPAGPEAPSEE